MLYEEKLAKIVFKLKEERKITRKGHKTKLTLDDKSFGRVRINDICKILLQLQDDEKVLTIIEALQPAETVSTETLLSPNNKDDYENVEIITVEFDSKFDEWYENYLMEQKTQLQNMDFINMLRIYDVIQDINEQIQLTNNTTVKIHIIPSLVRYQILFPVDTTGMRDKYCETRWDSLKYLKEKGIIDDFKNNKAFNRWETLITITLKLSAFDDFYEKIKTEYRKRNNKNNQTDEVKVNKVEGKIPWPSDFIWNENKFIFGKHGEISFTSNNRKHIFKTLTDKEGDWATIKELKKNKDDAYARTTISQIQKRFPENIKKVVKIISTQDDTQHNKPSVGAYRVEIQQP